VARGRPVTLGLGVSDFHLRVLQGAARSARERLASHRASPDTVETAETAKVDRQLQDASKAADAQVTKSLDRRRRPLSPAQSIAELDALATHARQKLALYRRRIYLGRGQPSKLAELERLSLYAAARAKSARRGEQQDEPPST
jgi:hypothetical protein